jgi:hypothetical protein
LVLEPAPLVARGGQQTLAENIVGLIAKSSAALSSVIGPREADLPSPKGPEEPKIERNQALKMVEAGGIEPPSEGLPATATTRLVCEF